MPSPTYATYAEAQAYFDERLHEVAWSEASQGDREKALIKATRIIDRLNFRGEKTPVYELLQTDPEACSADIAAANATQALQFPRGGDTDVPTSIKIACYEITYALLDGIDPELELENLGVTSHGYASVRSTYNRQQNPMEHISAGVPSVEAWRYLVPFLRNPAQLRINRV